MKCLPAALELQFVRRDSLDFNLEHVKGFNVVKRYIGGHRGNFCKILAGFNGKPVKSILTVRFYQTDSQQPLFLDDFTFFSNPGQLGYPFKIQRDFGSRLVEPRDINELPADNFSDDLRLAHRSRIENVKN